LLACFGIPVVRFSVVTSSESAISTAEQLGYPVALKAAAPELVHKSDVGGVALDLRDERAVGGAYADMERALGDAMGGAVVQQMVPSGVETIVGVTHDPSFGPLVLFGLGGVTAELLADRALRIVPITDEDARQLVRALRASPLLFGYRGRPAVDVGALENLLLRVGYLADEVSEISEMDLNPVIVGADGVVAVDVKIHVTPAPARLPADFRRMRL
jgi:acyl-CoA synthetase (NDP forming)